MFTLPTLQDKLFIGTTYSDDNYASINRSKGFVNESGFFYLIEGFRKITFDTLNNILAHENDTDWLKIDSLIQPILYNFRHYLELILKDTTRYYKLLNDEVYADEVGFKPGHSLKVLWDELKPYLVRQYRHDDSNQDDLQAVETLILELDGVDEGSFAFRYPFKRTKSERGAIVYSVQPMTIDLLNLKDVMEKIAYFFDSINMHAAELLDIKLTV